MTTLKIERDTVRKGTETVADATAAAASAAAASKDGHLPGTSGKHPHLEKLGTVITGGKSNAGTKGYLMVRKISLRRSLIASACASARLYLDDSTN